MKLAKPEVTPEIVGKWRHVVEVAARLARTPSCLVMKTDAPDHRVLIANASPGSPYRPGQNFRLHDRLYCQGVLKRRSELVVEDAATDPEWSDNEDLAVGMTFYIGLPVLWPDGEAFGTICLLDRRRNAAALEFREGLNAFRDAIETDLALLLEVAARRLAEARLRDALAELETRVAARTASLEEANAALRALIASLETARAEMARATRRRVEGLVKPHLARLRQGGMAAEPLRAQLDLVEAGLDALTDPAAGGRLRAYERLTPAEIEVAELVRLGCSSKDIARRLLRARSTVEFHRDGIRRKLGLARRANLRSHLLALE